MSQRKLINMADVTRAWIILVLCFICSECGDLSGKELFCRDPDTGKLYAVNTTWASTSFCGNYTCKFRKRNLTQTEYSPIRQINITKAFEEDETRGEETKSIFTIEKKADPDIQPILHRERASNIDDLNINPESSTLYQAGNDDRYLTDTEIKSISKLLHTVKKSDLDAIVEIYKLAQDIYKEMDKTTTESILDDTINSMKHEKNNKAKSVNNIDNKKRKSYWYDPITYNYKVKPIDVMEYQGSDAVPTTLEPKRDAALTDKDFRKLPYYYPMSSFQRLSSYTHTPTSLSETEKIIKPCNKGKEIAPNVNEKKVPYLFESQKLIQPSVLLPYPFAYIHHYNASSNPINAYFNGNPWAQYNFYNKHRSYQPYYNTAYVAHLPSNAILENPDLNYKIQDAEQKPIYEEDKNEKVKKPSKLVDILEWQTGEIPAHVLEEVRANVDRNRLIRPFPFRKHIQLERVGKVLKLDEFTRSKRSIEDEQNGKASSNNEYETYLEKITCQSETIPGFFRYGNLSRPYPECCPQRITEITKSNEPFPS